MPEKVFYQSSLPRSGSTLLQNILGQNPDIFVTPTSGLSTLLTSSRAYYTKGDEFRAQDPDIMRKAFIGYCRGAINGYFDAITDKKYVVDKSRAWGINYNFLKMINDDPKIICMVRDPRDVFASMEKNFRKNPDKQSAIVDWGKLEGTSIPKRIEIWGRINPVGTAFESLSEMINIGVAGNVLFVKFEDLCSNPSKEMERIYYYLGIPYFEHDFNNVEQITFEDDEVHGIYGDHKIRKRVEVVPSYAKNILGRDACDWIFNQYRWFFDAFKYPRQI